MGWVSGGGAAGNHDILSSTHSDVDDTDTPADGDVLTWDNANSQWIAQPSTGGSGGSVPWEEPVTTPPTTGWSWVNQGSATVATQTGGAILLDSPAAGAANVILRVRGHSAPSIVTARVTGLGLGTSSGVGLCFRESSTEKLILFFVRPIQRDIVVAYWTDATTASTTAFDTGNGDGMWPLVKWLQIEDDNTDLIFRVSDSGFDGSWIDLFSASRTAHLAGGPDEVGWLARDGNDEIRSVLASWEAT